MLFTSIEFFVFLPVVFALYWLLRKQLRWQNLLVVAASYIFYGWWDWRFLLLIAFTSACSYFSGLLISGGQWRKTALWGNIIVNLAILALFKYYDFFAAELATLLGCSSDSVMLHLVLPVGIIMYIRMIRFRLRLYKDLRTIRHTSDRIISYIYNNKV